MNLEINLENVNKAIAVMERVKVREAKFDMTSWQGGTSDDRVIFSEAELIECGAAACFAGWVGVSPEWREDGERTSYFGVPIWGSLSGGRAIAEWMGIPLEDGETLCMCGYDESEVFPEIFNAGLTWSSVTVEDVLKVLYRLRDTGSIYPAS